MILRPAMIGLALACIITAFVLFIPERAGDDQNLLPPRLFPIFSDPKIEEEPIIPPLLLELRKSPDHEEVMPGSMVTFRLIVKNMSDRTLSNLTVEERFDDDVFQVVDAGAGGISENRLSWHIAALQQGEEKTVRYSLRVRSDAPSAPIQTTAYVFGEELQTMRSSSRMASANIFIVSLPVSGADHGPILSWISEVLYFIRHAERSESR